MSQHAGHAHSGSAGSMQPLDPASLPAAVETQVVDIPPDGSYAIRVHGVAKAIGDRTFGMLAYNGSIPGPTLRVRQGSQITVDVTNETQVDTTIHWHGLRLENPYDGVPHETQLPIPPGGRYLHRLTFPDAGTFWYHPHIREDYAQELGLYGNILVEPADPQYWPPADRDVLLTLDDILIEDGAISPFDPHEANFVAMGRFGNVLLTSGQTDQNLQVRRGDVVRFHLTNTANTRVFKVSIPGVRLKLVGGDAGRYEHERWVDDVVVAPSERTIVDGLLETAGTFTLQHVTPAERHALATITVAEAPVSQSPAARDFGVLRTNTEWAAERERIAPYLDTAPDKTLAIVAEMDFAEPPDAGPVMYVCPMHPEVIQPEPGTCPKCAMKLMPRAVTASYTCPMHPEIVTTEPGRCPLCGMRLMPGGAAASDSSADDPHGEASAHGHGHGHGHGHADMLEGGVEWEDLMVEVNRTTTPANMRWKLVDRDSGKENARIDWVFGAGDQVKIRLVNEMNSDHPMHHPFHIHGERFLVLARDGQPEDNLVWKDTVLVTTGQTVDLLMDASNPGQWMAHCHIAEHLEGGMMFSFRIQGASLAP